MLDINVAEFILARPTNYRQNIRKKPKSELQLREMVGIKNTQNSPDNYLQ